MLFPRVSTYFRLLQINDLAVEDGSRMFQVSTYFWPHCVLLLNAPLRTVSCVLLFVPDKYFCACVCVCVCFSAVPAAPVNVSVTQLRAHSAMVTWNVPQGDTVIGYAISQQVQWSSLVSSLYVCVCVCVCLNINCECTKWAQRSIFLNCFNPQKSSKDNLSACSLNSVNLSGVTFPLISPFLPSARSFGRRPINFAEIQIERA